MTSAPVLRPYQDQGVADIRACYAAGAARVLYQAPTGSGKTVLFAFVVAGAAALGNKVAILGHRQEIVDQIDIAFH
jgi:superfamily II DNA or RNA helicase